MAARRAAIAARGSGARSVAAIRRDAERIGDKPRRIVHPREGARLVGRDQPAADREGGNAQNFPPVDQRQFGGAAADIDMQDAGIALLRQPHRAGPVGGERAFELVAGGGADEFAGFRGEQFVDRPGIVPLDRLAGEDHGATVDIVAAKAGLRVAVRNEGAERAPHRWCRRAGTASA